MALTSLTSLNSLTSPLRKLSLIFLLCISKAVEFFTLRSLSFVLYPSFFTLHLLLNLGSFHLVCLGLMVMMPGSMSCTSSKYSSRASEMTAI